jgi:hypothetical protein
VASAPAEIQHPYRLDHKPSDLQRRPLRRLVDGYQVALFPDGTFRVLQTHEVILEATLRACLRRQWVAGMPDIPLFHPDACRITPHGVAALRRQ